jgi:hypothetical protein
MYKAILWNMEDEKGQVLSHQTGIKMNLVLLIQEEMAVLQPPEEPIPEEGLFQDHNQLLLTLGEIHLLIQQLSQLLLRTPGETLQLIHHPPDQRLLLTEK